MMHINKDIGALGLRIGMQGWRWYATIDIGMQGGCGGMHAYQFSGGRQRRDTNGHCPLTGKYPTCLPQAAPPPI